MEIYLITDLFLPISLLLTYIVYLYLCMQHNIYSIDALQGICVQNHFSLLNYTVFAFILWNPQHIHMHIYLYTQIFCLPPYEQIINLKGSISFLQVTIGVLKDRDMCR